MDVAVVIVFLVVQCHLNQSVENFIRDLMARIPITAATRKTTEEEYLNPLLDKTILIIRLLSLSFDHIRF